MQSGRSDEPTVDRCVQKSESGAWREDRAHAITKGALGIQEKRKCRKTLGNFCGYMYGCNTED